MESAQAAMSASNVLADSRHGVTDLLVLRESDPYDPRRVGLYSHG